MKGYKLVRERGGCLYSFIMLAREVSVHYKKNKWNVPREGCGPLAVFNRLSLAREFLKEEYPRDGAQIWECEYEPSDLDVLHLKEKLFSLPLRFAPKGTVLATKVKLIKRVII